MPTQEDLNAELRRLADENEREAIARQKSYDMHGGDHRAPNEPEMPEIIAQYGDWAVTPDGVECLTHPYEIQWDSLLDPVTGDEFWLEKLHDKPYVSNLRDLSEAIRTGRLVHRYLQSLKEK